jgi:hypothetical protein
MFQLNLDGQQVTQKNAGSGFGQPNFSREAIAEFQIITNLFDITQGRSTGMQVNAISRSGTNTPSGSVYGSFRSDRFNSADPVANRVLPYSNQQIGGALGGPIIRDRLHYFFSYEREREPATLFAQPAALGGQSASFDTKATQNSYLGRMDWQQSTSNSLNVRASYWNWGNPFDQVSSNGYPAQGSIRTRNATNVIGTWSHVASSNRISQLHVGYNGFTWQNLPVPELLGVPEYVFSNITIGPRNNYPQTFWQKTWQARYDLNLTYSKHTIKIGTEVFRGRDTATWFLGRAGRMFFTQLPSPAEMARRFPIDQWNNPAAWDVAGLDSIVQRFDINYHPLDWAIDIPRPQWAVWFGDTWQVMDRLTLNYGIRYDLDWGATAPPGITENTILIDNGRDTGDFGYRADIRDLDNVSPRVGFTYNVGGENDFVIRGGTGLFYASHVSNITNNHQLYNQLVAASFVNDGRPGFALDPTRGVTEQDVLSGAVAVPPQQKIILDPDFKIGYTWQSSIGFQKQLSPVLAVESDLTHWKWYNEGRTRDVNLFFDPVTGYNIDPRLGRPNPNYTQIAWQNSLGKRDEMALSTAVTRRLRDNLQGGLTYTFMFFKHDDGSFGFTSGTANNQFDPYDGEWARSTDFQRHTLRMWTMYEFPWNMSVSGVYLYGSGNYYVTSISGAPFGKPGTNRLNIRGPITIPEAIRDRFEGPAVIETGAVTPRNALRGTALHKVDLRVQQIISLPGRVRLQLIGEVFNLLNHDNFGSFVTQVDNARFGQPTAILGNAYAPRSGQLGFRLSF